MLSSTQLPWSPLTRKEVKSAFFSQKPDKAPGLDTIPFRVWHQLWPVVEEHIFQLYSSSLELAFLPSSWRVAKIIAMAKPNKKDRTVPNAYRPISLIPTISKGLEAVIASRMSYLAETHNLLPENHFGARRRRSCEQAVNVVIEKIYDAWREGNVLTLITFDVQGAYNGVKADLMAERLRQRKIPEKIVKWVESFCTNRKACLAFGKYCSEILSLVEAGLPQGSPLSPLSYIFYNADLIEIPITKTEGGLGFIDDFSAWVVGKSVSENLERIENEVITRVVRWAQASGATFEKTKTELIHFTRNLNINPRPYQAIQFEDSFIAPQDLVKLLGVILDKQLRMKEHVSNAASKAISQFLAFERLPGIKQKAIRQL